MKSRVIINITYSFPLLLALFAAPACESARRDAAAGPAPDGTLSLTGRPRQSRPEVETILASMSVEEKVGQCFVVGGNANYLNEESPEYLRLRRLVEKYHVGGIIWYRSKVAETALLNLKLQSLARVPMIISADLEAGMGMRFDDTPWAPWPMAIAATGDVTFAEDLGYLTSVEARAMGISQIFAPVADVNVNPANPVINTRSFGEDPAEVSRFVNAFVKGCERGGVLATVKHFPGHGDTDVDSHRSLPMLSLDRERLEKIELLPFRRAFEAGCRSVMIAHLAVPALDPEAAPLLKNAKKVYGGEEEREKRGTLPATVSPRMVNGLLRKEMGFDGLAVTDAMDMGGLADHFDAKEGAIRAILAGCDQIVKSGEPEAAMEGVAAAVRGGRISMEVLDAAVRRILREKIRLNLFEPELCNPPILNITKEVASPAHDAVLRKMAQRSITLLRAEPGALPVATGKKILHLAVSDESGTPGFVYSNLAFTTPLREVSGGNVMEFRIHPRTTPAETREILDAAKSYEQVVMSLNVKARTGAGAIQAPAAAVEIARELQRSGKPVIAVVLGSPYVSMDFPEVKTMLLAWGSADVSQRAAAAAIFGKFKITGRLPVTIPGVAKRGDGIQQ